MAFKDLTKRERRDQKQAKRREKRRLRSSKQRLNRRLKRSSLIIGIVMTMPTAPKTDTLEYMTLKMIVRIWPNAVANHAKGLSNLEVAVLTTKSIVRRDPRFSVTRVENAAYFAVQKIEQAFRTLKFYEIRQQPLPTDFLTSAVEHSLANLHEPWRQQLAEVN